MGESRLSLRASPWLLPAEAVRGGGGGEKRVGVLLARRPELWFDESFIVKRINYICAVDLRCGCGRSLSEVSSRGRPFPPGVGEGGGGGGGRGSFPSRVEAGGSAVTPRPSRGGGRVPAASGEASLGGKREPRARGRPVAGSGRGAPWEL